MIAEIIKQKQRELDSNGVMVFSDEELANLDNRELDKIIDIFRGFGLMKLPQQEIDFFEWLKENDSAIWRDLWEYEDEPYIVSIDFLNRFRSESNGFPICDLENNKNYWFHEKHIKPKGKERIVDIDDKIRKKQKLTIDELFILEILRAPIDIWHFCYRYKLPVNLVKQKVEYLEKQDFIVHLTKREDLVKYIEI